MYQVSSDWPYNDFKAYRLVEDTIAKYSITLVDIYNFDETGFMMGLIASGMVVTGAERRGKAKSMQPGNQEWVAAIQVMNAEGWAIAPFVVVAGQYHLASWYRESNLPDDWAIATTHHGSSDNETGLEWLRHFDRHTKGRSTGHYRLLILDGHESHHSVDFEQYLLNTFQQQFDMFLSYGHLYHIFHIASPSLLLSFPNAKHSIIPPSPVHQHLPGSFGSAPLAEDLICLSKVLNLRL
ncbi:hypothetical protein HOO65_050288 [Ceratocystis lukuohia]|uniref:DDE-1 domain-containing protein n=1 Tax=Ceratocystis lukuohia TaxID=2019550 RepID=A0ABR4MFW5_9PEZI